MGRTTHTMSLFSTKLPVNVQELLDALPPGHHLHGIAYDKQKQEIVVLWETDKFKTGYTFPVDYPFADVLAKRAPKGLKAKKATQTPSNAKNAPTGTPDPKETILPPAPPDNLWDKEKLVAEQAGLKEGEAIEYQGVESTWNPLETDHVWQQGFFYRKVQGALKPATEEKPADKSGVDTPTAEA